jgi:NAD(P)-dependent dehydrogenase (short-subunit alcohol dehydrogenase family)
MNIIVTGASRGVGNALVREFAKDPGNHIVAIARDKPALTGLQKECLNELPEAHVYPIGYDLTHGAFQDRLLPEIESAIGKADILINNAGLLVQKPFLNFTPGDLDRIFDVNFKSVVRLIQALLPFMSPGAHIVNIGSMGGVQGSVKFSGMSLYSASKGALAILTECLAEELQPAGISVNMLALGAVDTAMLQKAFPGYKAPVSPAEMATFIAFFARTGHHFMNGKIIPLSLSTP